jgi:hypothetical protein
MAGMAPVRPVGDVMLPTGESLVILQLGDGAPQLVGVDARSI